ncbi:MAG TPA: hypothetical protein VFW40_07870 [Capsulimonadaceae bacterium]|nr:hypothetical protein [Capsulimonadaceae bacterium]
MSAMSKDSWNAEGRTVWESEGKKCARCECELPDFRDCRMDSRNLASESSDGRQGLYPLCLACYMLRGAARRWRTANMGAMIAAGILPANWREFVWFEGETA